MGGGHGLSLVPAGHMDRSMCHPILAPRAPYMFDVFLPLHLGAGFPPPPKDVVFVFWSWTSDPGGPVGPRPKGTPISEVYSIVVA